MTDQSLYSIRTASPLVLPPEPEDNPAKAKPWFIAPVFDNPHSTNLQDVIRVLMEKTARAEMIVFHRKYSRVQAHTVSEAGLEEIRKARRRAAWEKARRNEARLLAVMDEPMTVPEIGRRAKMSVEGAREILWRMLSDEKVFYTMDGRNRLWRRSDAK